MRAVLVFAAVLVIVAVIAVGGYFYITGLEKPSTFRTVSLTRGNLESTISATGTVEPEEVVDVGAQVAGRILSLGIDPRTDQDPKFRGKTIDYNSPVHKDTILAVIDDAVYRAQRDQAQASLNRAKADQAQAEAKLLQAKQEYDRAQRLRSLQNPGNTPNLNGAPLKAISGADYDAAVANYEVAKANVAVSKAAVEQSSAALLLAKTNLEYTVIKSPVEGKIIDRRVNVGQTVVASLNAPSLFLIGRDMRRMQVWAAVNEADIGRIRPNMPVGFTVDAFPGETFKGRVEQIRLNASINQNVVTYMVIIAYDNSDLKLIPYLTANVRFELETRKNILTVSNAALRWKPRTEQIHPDIRATFLREKSKKSRDDGGTGKTPAAKSPQDDVAKVWVADEGYVRPIEVKIGVSDGAATEISGEKLTEGMELVIGDAAKSAGGDDSQNPFAPKLFGGKKTQ